MNAVHHALQVLEFPRVLETVSRHASSEAGARRVVELLPGADVERVRSTLSAVAELARLVSAPENWRLDAIPDLSLALERLSIDDARLEPEDLLACGRVLALARTVRGLEPKLEPEGLPAREVARLWSDPELEKRIERTFEADGSVSDRASSELKRIRRALVKQRGRLVQRLDAFARELPERVRVADASVTVRNGRYCVPVRREGKGAVGGLVHDASASRQTLFVEPTIAIDDMNEIRELELAEVREVERVLRELSQSVRVHRVELADAYDALIELDALRARAVFAAELNAEVPTFGELEQGIRLRGARHPILAIAPDGAVPFDLDLAPDERVLLVSGPNAGGKTVLLKTIGLISALAQSGVVPPVGTETRIPFFRRIFAVIGDEQSIDASLSTFGAQAANLAEILNEAESSDLVLIDEIGSATDPAEGGALAAASLKRLATQVRLTVATTHLGDLKRLEDEARGTVNASLEFDGKRLEPTYRLVRDRPGRSYALVIAARLGVPEDVLEDARARLGDEHASLDTLLARLEEDRAELEDARAQWARDAEALEARDRDVRERESRANELERAAKVERENARLDAFKEARADVEAAIARLEAEYAEADPDVRDAERRRVRSEVERGIRETRDALKRSSERASSRTGDVPRQGDTVRWQTSARSGELVEVRGDRGVVEVDGLRLTLPLSELDTVEGAAAEPKGPAHRRASADESDVRRPEFALQTEIDLRGLRVEDVDAALHPALDAAVVGELPWLRIIHGKGTGALRERVKVLLKEDPRVRMFREGEPNEGGHGVTVVEFE